MAYKAYLRVSTEDQAEAGGGLAAQLDSCRTFVERKDENLTTVYEDSGISGAKGLDQRPALLQAVENLERGDVLVVAKRDRLGRDPIHVAMIERAVERKGAKVASAAGEGTEGSDPANILMRRMIDAFAEYERLIIGARTKAALQAKKKKGHRIGSVPYGFTLSSVENILVENPKEQQVINQVRRLRGEGLSLRQIASRLREQGHRSRTGKIFAPVQVQRMLAA